MLALGLEGGWERFEDKNSLICTEVWTIQLWLTILLSVLVSRREQTLTADH